MTDDIRIKDCEYNNYIREHIKNVNKAWDTVKLKLVWERWLDDSTYFNINHRVRIHDLSKFSNEEFNGYRQYFYPDKKETKSENHFEMAWLRHIHTNDHHWNHWVICGDTTRSLDMPFVCMFEMLLDWSAMSIKFGGSPREYYEANKSKMKLHEGTMKGVENWIDLFGPE